MSRNLWVLTCFLVFNVSVVTYAVVYCIVYRRRPESFLFTAELYRVRTTEFRANAERLLLRLTAEIAALSDLQAVLIETSELPPLDVDRPLPKNVSWRLVWRAVGSFTGAAAFGHFIEVKDADRKLISSISFAGGADKPTVERQIDRRMRRQLAHQRRLASLSSELPEIWSFPDFLYFSLITQSTVGYGDILPNSTVVRLIVASQIWASYVILVVLINIVLP